jgi:hypothetical protein
VALQVRKNPVTAFASDLVQSDPEGVSVFHLTDLEVLMGTGIIRR